VAIQPDGRILVAGEAAPPFTASTYVARLLPDGSFDTDFGEGGVRTVPGFSDHADVGGLALRDDGMIYMAGMYRGDGSGQSDSTSRPFVVRLTADGELDTNYGTNGTALLPIPGYATARALVLQDGKAVIAGSIEASLDPSDFSLLLARLDDQGSLDETFGAGGVVLDRPIDRGTWRGNALALWGDKLVVAGTNSFNAGDTDQSFYVLARYLSDGTVDESFNPDVPEPGHVVTTTGSERSAGANDLAVDADTGAATITGFADHDGKRRLLIDRFNAGGVRDPNFVGSNGNGGPVLLDAGDGGKTIGNAAALDDDGGLLVAGQALDADVTKFLLARFGGTPPTPTPNAKPFARIRGHHTVPRKTLTTFRGGRSYDTDGEIVQWAWKVGHGRFHNRGPLFQHRFGRTGTRTVILRVTDDDGAVGFARFRVKVLSKRG
jgi:uncharacterized delta-60 repeat protein